MDKNHKSTDFKFFAAPRIAGGVFAVLLIIWIASLFTGHSDKHETDTSHKNIQAEHTAAANDTHKVTAHKTENLHAENTHGKTTDPHAKPAAHETSAHAVTSHDAVDSHGGIHEPETPLHENVEVSHDAKPSHGESANSHGTDSAHETAAEAGHENTAHGEAAQAHGDSHGGNGHGEAKESMYKPSANPRPDITGWSFVEAAVAPLEYELTQRSFGWRPNDIIIGKFTDNVNNFQRGVLEVTRRTAVKLAEDISRTGSTSSFNRHLESAMNWFMIRPDKFWFPSAEGKYESGILELKKYQEQLVRNESRFFNRTDNLIPLLKAYRNLLGSCDDNLVKHLEDDGTKVSFFKADDYFSYSKGVAKSMAHILKAIEHDFHPILESRNGLGSLHHAIHALEEAEEIDPMIILNNDLSGFLSNHRANLATAISHGRFYLGILITTLST